MRRLPIYISFIFLALAGSLYGQGNGPVTNATKWEVQNYLMNSLKEINPNFLHIAPFETIGATEFGGKFSSGDLHLAQEPDKSSQLSFGSQRYQKLDKVKIFGSFGFRQQWQEGVILTESLNPYRGNPYIAGDSMSGDWNKQWYDLKLIVSSAPLLNDRLFLGIGLNYSVGSGARQEDPRPLALIKDLDLEPSALWKINDQNMIGIKGHFNSFNEDVSLEIRNPNTNHNLYKMLGPVEIFNPLQMTYASSLTRNYKGNTAGGSLQYGYKSDVWLGVLSAGLHSRTEDVRDGVSNPSKAGRLEETLYKIDALIQRTSPSAINMVTVNWQQADRDGIESHQRLVSDGPNSSQLNETIFQSVFMTSLKTDAKLEYSWLRLKNGTGYDWLLKASANYRGLDSRYLFPQNKEIADVMQYGISAKRNWDAGNSNFSLEAKAVLQQKMTSTLEIEPGKGSSFVRENLIYPDHAYLAGNLIQPGIRATYSNKLKGNSSWFISGAADFVSKTGKNEAYIPDGNRRVFQLSIGAFY